MNDLTSILIEHSELTALWQHWFLLDLTGWYPSFSVIGCWLKEGLRRLMGGCPSMEVYVAGWLQ